MRNTKCWAVFYRHSWNNPEKQFLDLEKRCTVMVAREFAKRYEIVEIAKKNHQGHYTIVAGIHNGHIEMGKIFEEERMKNYEVC